jgi:hypothetical protein
MKGGLDAGHDARGHALEALGLPDIFQDRGQDLPAIVLFPEKALVELLHPRLAPPVRDESQHAEPGVDPAAASEDIRDRFLSVEREVQGE